MTSLLQNSELSEEVIVICDKCGGKGWYSFSERCGYSEYYVKHYDCQKCDKTGKLFVTTTTKQEVVPWAENEKPKDYIY